MIFGWNSNYDELVNSVKIETLDSRRDSLVLKFAKKAAASTRFCRWFEKRDYGDLNLRKEMKYVEKKARKERLKKSPLFYMRRALNNE